jgi:hypothetical protein
MASVWNRSESIVGRVDGDGTVWDGLSIVGRFDSADQILQGGGFCC